MSEYAQLDSPKISRVHPTTSTRSSSHHDDDEKSFRSISSKFSRASRKSLHNGELGTSLISSNDNDEESSSGDRDDSFSTAISSPEKNGAVSPSSLAMTSSPVNSPSYYETATMAQDDPFFIFRGDLVKKLLVVERQLDRYLEVVRTTVSSYSTFALIWFTNSCH
jgi:hypothetical protein